LVALLETRRLLGQLASQLGAKRFLAEATCGQSGHVV
jgi:hypothetical protein